LAVFIFVIFVKYWAAIRIVTFKAKNRCCIMFVIVHNFISPQVFYFCNLTTISCLCNFLILRNNGTAASLYLAASCYRWIRDRVDEHWRDYYWRYKSKILHACTVWSFARHLQSLCAEIFLVIIELFLGRVSYWIVLATSCISVLLCNEL